MENPIQTKDSDKPPRSSFSKCWETCETYRFEILIKAQTGKSPPWQFPGLRRFTVYVITHGIQLTFWSIRRREGGSSSILPPQCSAHPAAHLPTQHFQSIHLYEYRTSASWHFCYTEFIRQRSEAAGIISDKSPFETNVSSCRTTPVREAAVVVGPADPRTAGGCGTVVKVALRHTPRQV